MKATTIRLSQGFSVLIILLLLPGILAAQVIIKERVEIKPTPRIMAKSNFGSEDLGCLEGTIGPTGENQLIKIRRPCKIVATGSISSLYLSDMWLECATNIPPQKYIDITNTVDSIGGIACDNIWVSVGSGNTPPLVVSSVSGSASGDDANISFMGYHFCYIDQNFHQFTVTVTIHATALYRDPDTCRIGASADCLVANWEEYPIAVIGAMPCDTDSVGTPYAHCVDIPMRFTIENPIDDVKLRDWENDSNEGNSITTYLANENAYVYILWDPTTIHRDYDTVVNVKAEGLCVSALQKIELIKVLPEYFILTPEKDEIFRYQSVTLRAIAMTIDDKEETLGGEVPVTFIDETEEGSFIVGSDTIPKQVTVPYDTARNGGVKYYACGSQTDVWLGVSRMVPYAGDGDAWVEVIPPCPVVSTKREASVGDTVAVSIKALRWDDVLVPYAEDQEFEIWMTTDESYGKLRSIVSGDEGTDLYGPQPFEFIAADSINADSVVVVLKVLASSGGTAGLINSTSNDTSHRSAGILLKKQTSGEMTNTAQGITKEEKIKRLLEKVKKRLSEISGPSREVHSSISLWKDNHTISKPLNHRLFGRSKEVLGRLEEKLEHKLFTISEAKNKSSQLKTKVTKLGKIVMSVSIMEEGEECAPVDTVVIKKAELIVYPPVGNDKNQYIEGTDLPKMPKPIVKAQLKDYNGGEVDFHWILKIHWKSDIDNWETPQDENEKYEGDASGQNSDIVDLEVGQTLYGETDMRGGNDITLTVTAKTVDGKVYATNPADMKNPFVVKGKNPDVATVLAEFNNHLYTGYTADNYAAVAWQESRFNQFADNVNAAIAHPHSTTPAYPLQGGDDFNDFGFMGIRLVGKTDWDYATDDLIWNWVANAQQGQTYFNKQIDRAKNYQNMKYFKTNYKTTPDPLNNVPTSTDTSQNQVFLQAYCYYNGGINARYWDWVKPVINESGQTLEPGHWIKNRQTWPDPVSHVDELWESFTSNPKPWLQ